MSRKVIIIFRIELRLALLANVMTRGAAAVLIERLPREVPIAGLAAV